MKKTAGTMTAMKRIISQVKRCTPWSKLLCWWRPRMLWAMPPKYVLRPVVTMAAVADPLSTLVPMKQMLLSSSGATPVRVSAASNFSTGNDSPVRLAWLMKRPGPQHAHVGGNHVPGRQGDDVAGHEVIEGDFPLLTAADHRGRDVDHRLQFGRRGVARVSWKNRMNTLKNTMTAMMTPVDTSPVKNEMTARIVKRMLSGSR